ncbi:hypothetical protein SALBM311S_05178 [Streptomyces alboniger]
MREGQIARRTTPPDALRTRTDSETVAEAAFLHLVDEAIAADRTKETGR